MAGPLEFNNSETIIPRPTTSGRLHVGIKIISFLVTASVSTIIHGWTVRAWIMVDSEVLDQKNFVPGME